MVAATLPLLAALALLLCAAGGATALNSSYEFRIDANTSLLLARPRGGAAEFGTVCDDLWPFYEAQATADAICRFAGYGADARAAYFTYGSLASWQTTAPPAEAGIVLDNVNCRFNASDFERDCSYSVRHDCTTAENLGLQCAGANATTQYEFRLGAAVNGFSVLQTRPVTTVRDAVVFTAPWGTVSAAGGFTASTTAYFCRLLGFAPQNGVRSAVAAWSVDVGPQYMEGVSCRASATPRFEADCVFQMRTLELGEHSSDVALQCSGGGYSGGGGAPMHSGMEDVLLPMIGIAITALSVIACMRCLRNRAPAAADHDGNGNSFIAMRAATDDLAVMRAALSVNAARRGFSEADTNLAMALMHGAAPVYGVVVVGVPPQADPDDSSSAEQADPSSPPLFTPAAGIVVGAFQATSSSAAGAAAAAASSAASAHDDTSASRVVAPPASYCAPVVANPLL